MSHTVVAIDGPSASGKSTVARAVARAMQFRHVDSGALYRGITWRALQIGLDCHDADVLTRWVDQLRFDLEARDDAMWFSVDDASPDPESLRSAAVVEAVSDVAAVPAVRRVVGQQLHAMTGFGDLVIEGRDIGTVVFPDTPHKFFVDADPEERARRRSAESGGDAQQVQASLQRRDRKDRNRPAAPLRCAADALRIDTTHLSVEQVVARILERIRR